MGNVGNVEVAILLTTTLADKVRFLRTLPFEDVTDHRQNTQQNTQLSFRKEMKRK